MRRGRARDQGNQQRHHGDPDQHLNGWLGALKNNNAQGEYYLTDIVAQAVANGVPVVSAQPSAEWEVAGVNSKVQLAELERRHQLNIAMPCWKRA
jgi:bifunctional UDP-N-acetylglucosamine pyrophosphorylase/glucosamine-1-phosphate N-acetyltransferase